MPGDPAADSVVGPLPDFNLGQEVTPMFKRFPGGALVKDGTYLDLREGAFVSIPQDGDHLPGGGDRTFIKAPLSLVLVLGPLLGLLFVIFLPLAVPLLVGTLLVQRLRRTMPAIRDTAIQVTTFGQRPGMAHLQMKGDSKVNDEQAKEPEDTSVDELDSFIDDLERDIAQRREAGEK